MHMQKVEYIIMAFGALLSVTGVILFSRMGAKGTNTIKWRGLELSFTGSSLLIFLVGSAMFLTPLLLHNDPPDGVLERLSTNKTCAFDQSLNVYYKNAPDKGAFQDLDTLDSVADANMSIRIVNRIHTLLIDCGFSKEEVAKMEEGRDVYGWKALLKELEIIR